jgi:acetyl esterase/lipase
MTAPSAAWPCPGVTPSAGCPTPLPPPATCDGAPGSARRLAGRPRRRPLRAELPAAAEPIPAARPTSEDCLYLNVSTPTLRSSDRDDLPVLVWIHGGGLTQDADRDYAGTRLAADGTAVFTINYRLGALGFLAHPALASRPGGPPATAG